MKSISTTNVIIFMLVLATIVFTYKGLVDAKDFMGVVLMVLSYKFGRAQGQQVVQSSTNQLG